MNKMAVVVALSLSIYPIGLDVVDGWHCVN